MQLKLCSRADAAVPDQASCNLYEGFNMAAQKLVLMPAVPLKTWEQLIDKVGPCGRATAN